MAAIGWAEAAVGVWFWLSWTGTVCGPIKYHKHHWIMSAYEYHKCTRCYWKYGRVFLLKMSYQQKPYALASTTHTFSEKWWDTMMSRWCVHCMYSGISNGTCDAYQ